MAQKSFEWKLALDGTGVTKTTKGLEKEVQGMKKSFESLNKIKAFTQGQADLKSLEQKLSSARTKMAEAGKAAEKGGARQQTAYRKAAAEVEKLDKAIRTQIGQLAKHSAALKKSGVSTRKIAEEQKRAELAYKATSTQLKASAAAQQQYDTLGIRSSKQIRAEQAARVEARRKLAASGKATAADLRRADAAVAAGAKKAAAEIAGGNKKASKSYKDLAQAAGGYFAVQRAGTAALGAIQFYAEFDDKLRETKAASGATAEEFEKLKQKAIELGRSPGLTPTDMAAGMAEAARAGQDVNEILASVAANAQLTAASELEFGEAVELTTDILAQFGRGAEDTQNLVDVLIAGANSASVKVGQLGEAYSYAGATSDALGISTNKVAAQFLVLANSALKAERGGTSLRAIWDVLLKKQKKLKDLGVDVTSIQNGKEEVRDLADIVDDLAKAELSAVERTEIFGKIAGPGVAILLKKGGDEIRRYEKSLDNAAGAGQRVADIMQEGLGGKGIRSVVSAWEILKINAVDAVLPSLETVGGLIADVINVISDLPKPVIQAALGLGTLATGFIGVTSAVAAWSVIGPTVAAAATSIAAAAAATATLAAPYAVIAAGAVSVGVAIKEFYAMREAQKMAGEAAERAAEQEKKYQDRLAKASAQSGLVLSSYKDIQAAYKAGKLDYDALTDTYSKGSGVPRKVAEEHEAAAKVIAKSSEQASAAVYKSAEVQEISLETALAQWQEYASKIRDIDQQIEEIGSFGGGGVSGLQQVNGEWQYFATNTEKAKAAMEGLNNTSQLGISSLKDKIFELSLAGKSDIEVWNDRKRAAEQYTQAAKATAAEAQQLAQAGQQDEANRKFAQSIEIAKKAEAAYKSLATEVKSEWTPAMEAAHKKASEGVKKYEKEADKALSDAAKHYDKARAAGEKLADKQADLADKLRDVGRAGMTPAAAYQDMAAQAREYEAAARSALAAGEFEKAVELAGRAESAWDSLGNEVKDGERTVVSAQQALAQQASGIQSAGQVAIDALKAQQAAEEKAAKAAEEKAKKATAAREAEAAKVKALEAEKEKVIISAEEGAQEAAAGTVEANQLLVDILEKQKTAIGEVADALNRQAEWSLGDTFTEAGESLKAFDGSLKEFDGNWGEVWNSMQTKGEESIQVIEDRLDRLVAAKRVVTVEIKEVTGASSGAVAGVSGASTGTIVGSLGQFPIKDGAAGFRVPGWGGGDSLRHLYALEGGEPVTNKYSARHFDYPFFKRVNAGDEVGAAKAMVARFPALQKVFGQSAQRSVRPVIMPQYMTKPLSPAAPQGVDSELKALLAGLQRVQSVDYVDGSQYDYLISQQANEIREARKARHASLKERLSR